MGFDPAVHHWPNAPMWALGLGIAGKAFIILAIVLFVGAIVAWAKSGSSSSKLGSLSFVLGAASVFAALVCLGTLFVNNQFEYGYIFQHSDANIELKYKIAGIWAGQEGSFLLWACTSSIFGVLAARTVGPYRRWFTIVYAIFLAGLCGILSYETPFHVESILGHFIVPPAGAGLTPSLQNYWVVIHPPTIFSGFGSLTVAFALGLSAMLTGNVTDWVAIGRPWALLSSAILGLGLSMGGFWAYETLGWGGFWMWDPVENVSFVPWILSIALVHGLIVQATKKRNVISNLALAGAPFVLFSYGTFLTRSGFLADASVHSFAEMKASALWILLVIVAAAILIYYGVFAFKGRKLGREATTTEPESGVNRESMYASAIFLLSGLATAVAIGMSVPFFMALTHHDSKVVEEGLYHRVVVWFFFPLLILMGATPFIGWRRLGMREILMRLLNVIAISFGIMGFFMAYAKFGTMTDLSQLIEFPLRMHLTVEVWIPILVSVCVFCGVANMWRLVETLRRSKMSGGGFVAHMGIAILFAGLIISRGMERKDQILMQEGDTGTGLGYTVSYLGMTHNEEQGVLNRDNKVLFNVSGPDGDFTARPGLYYVMDPDGTKAMVWPHIEHMLTHDIYFMMYAPQLDVWKDPIEFQRGQTIQPDSSIRIQYNGYKMIGQPGKVGTKFVADAIVSIKDNDEVWHAHDVQPGIEIAQGGIQPDYAQVDDNFIISMDSMNAADGSARFQMHFTKPVYAIDMIYKPMVALVWIGVGVTFLGGLMAAYYRRPSRPKPAEARAKKPVPDDLDNEPQ
jgi:cytochrome c-type biogenesis protein CcmF